MSDTTAEAVIEVEGVRLSAPRNARDVLGAIDAAADSAAAVLVHAETGVELSGDDAVVGGRYVVVVRHSHCGGASEEDSAAAPAFVRVTQQVEKVRAWEAAQSMLSALSEVCDAEARIPNGDAVFFHGPRSSAMDTAAGVGAELLGTAKENVAVTELGNPCETRRSFALAPIDPACARFPLGARRNAAVSELPRLRGPTMRVCVSSMTGARSFFNVPRDAPVAWLLAMLHKEQGASLSARIIFAGKQLECSHTLAEYGVTDGSLIHEVMRLRGGKPVVLFYPPVGCAEPIRGVTARVDVDQDLGNIRLTALHPMPQQHSPTSAVWSGIDVHPDGSLVCNGRSVAYLFWECEVDPAHPLLGVSALLQGDSEDESLFCVPSAQVGDFLDDQLALLGLSVRERTDMVTFWLADMQADSHVLLRFLPQSTVDRSVALTIDLGGTSGIGVMVSRVYFVFQSVSASEAAAVLSDSKRKCHSSPRPLQLPVSGSAVARDPSKLAVVEWGAVQIK